jgi:DNA-binding protein Fis
LGDFEIAKSKKKKIERLSKSIIKYLNRIDEEYRGPEKISDFWDATKELKHNSLVEHQYLKHAQLPRDPKELKEIWVMGESDLLNFYYKGLLKISGGNITSAAKMAGLKSTTFRAKLKKYGVDFKRK